MGPEIPDVILAAREVGEIISYTGWVLFWGLILNGILSG